MATDYTKLKHPLKGRGASYSTLKSFAACKLRTYFSKVMRIQPDFGGSTERGIRIHLKGESFLRGKIKTPTKEYKQFADELKELRELKAQPEAEFAVDKNWKPCEYDQYNKTGKVLFRIKLDAVVITEEDSRKTAHIVDYKTGKVYDDHEEQGEVYAAIIIAHFPEVDEINVEFWYLDVGGLGDSPFTYTAKQARALITKWKNAALDFDGAPMPALKKPSISNKNCGRCGFRDDKKTADGTMGPCQHWRKIP